MWVTSANPKIDRIACPRLILRFIEPDALFVNSSPERVLVVTGETGGGKAALNGKLVLLGSEVKPNA
jgi:hypothetical protein